MIEQLLAYLQENKDLPLDEKVAIYNQISSALFDFMALEHPVLGVQMVKADDVQGNDYNPNKVAPPEMQLLRTSIRKDGLTMPIVVADDGMDGYIVVDGFHRTTVIKTSKDINESTGGYVPVVKLNKDLENRITATVRHNMARGSHQVELSAKLVTALHKHNWSNERIGKELGMDADEVLRLKQITGMAEAFADREFSKSWLPSGTEKFDEE